MSNKKKTKKVADPGRAAWLREVQEERLRNGAYDGSAPRRNKKGAPSLPVYENWALARNGVTSVVTNAVESAR